MMIIKVCIGYMTFEQFVYYIEQTMNNLYNI